jgi:hypothetical protein
MMFNLPFIVSESNGELVLFTMNKITIVFSECSPCRDQVKNAKLHQQHAEANWTWDNSRFIDQEFA